MTEPDLKVAAALLADPARAVALPMEMRQRLLESMATPKALQVEGTSARCFVHSVTEDARVRKFKEPWTIEWLRSLPADAVLYDIGANIGITVLIGALGPSPGVRVVAIEPAPINFASLVKNVALNGLSDRVYPLPVGVGAATGVAALNLATRDPGGAMHSFGSILQIEGDLPRQSEGLHYCLCARLDDIVRWNGLPFPTHVKIDVDGSEWDALQGGSEVFRDPRVRAVQIEVCDVDGERTPKVKAFMAAAGLHEVACHARRPQRPSIADWQFARRAAVA
jgi:FkbM family methyltransferase